MSRTDRLPRIRALALGAAVLIVPAAAVAQPYPPSEGPPPYGYDQGCNHAGGAVIGALIGAGIGAVLGSNIAASGHRGDGAALGAGVGAVGGGLTGAYAVNCQGQPLPPPPPGYSQNDNSWDDAAPPGPGGR
jgi:hypothetical protein